MAKQKFSITNWKTYNKALINSGSITFWLDDEAVKVWYETATPSSRGRPQRYSDLAITTVLVIKRIFRLTLRAAQGFIDSIFALMGIPLRCPDYSSVSKRAKSVNVSFKTPLDAVHCQVETLRLISQRKGEFIVGIKGNQKKLYEFVKQRFSSCYDDEGLATYAENNQAHGRTEYRQVMQIDADFPEELKQRWPTIRTLIEVVSERGERGKPVHRESRWYVSSLPVDAQAASQMIREHGCIENQLHWVLDVVFREDEM